MLTALSREKTAQFASTNLFLESLSAFSHGFLDEAAAFQSYLEKGKIDEGRYEAAFAAVKRQGLLTLRELQAARARLETLKIALCRFIVCYESPSRHGTVRFSTLEEWLDAAALAEMRLTHYISPEGDKNLQKLLALFMTFRSIVCSFEGPLLGIRQAESALASLESLFEKVKLELEMHHAHSRLKAASEELSTVKNDLSQMQRELSEKKQQAETLTRLISLQDRAHLGKLVLLLFAAAGIIAAAAYLVHAQFSRRSAAPPKVISQKTCVEIYENLEKSPRYRGQVLVFKKFGRVLYFQANHLTCEKLHALDSNQVGALAAVLEADHEKAAQARKDGKGDKGDKAGSPLADYPVMQVKDIGIQKLAVRLGARTDKDLAYKLQVLEAATTLRATLKPAAGEAESDYLVIDLSLAKRTGR